MRTVIVTYRLSIVFCLTITYCQVFLSIVLYLIIGERHRTITFIPPKERFVLCKYTASICPTQVSTSGNTSTPTLSRRGSVTSLNSTTSSLTVMSQASSASLPMRAFYEMTGSKDEVKIIMRVKLVKGRNMFEYCEVQIPFHNR